MNNIEKQYNDLMKSAENNPEIHKILKQMADWEKIISTVNELSKIIDEIDSQILGVENG